MNLKGVIKVIGKTQTISDKFSKVDFVLTDDSSQYPQHISIQATNDRIAILNGVKVGDRVTVHINIRGREWTSPQGEIKYFNTIEAWKIDRDVATTADSHKVAISDNEQGFEQLPF